MDSRLANFHRSLSWTNTHGKCIVPESPTHMTYNYTLQQEEEYDLAWQEEKDEERETIQVGPIIGGQEGHDTSRW